MIKFKEYRHSMTTDQAHWLQCFIFSITMLISCIVVQLIEGVGVGVKGNTFGNIIFIIFGSYAFVFAVWSLVEFNRGKQ